MPDDKLIFGREFHGELLGPIDLFHAQITDDARYLVITIERGVPATSRRHRLSRSHQAQLAVRRSCLGARLTFLRHMRKNGWYIRTDYNSPMGRILKADPGVMPEAWKTIVPEGKDVLREFHHRRRQSLRQAPPRCEVRNRGLHARRQACWQNRIRRSSAPLPLSMAGPLDRYGFFSFESYIQPPTLYRLDTLTGKRDSSPRPKFHSIPANSNSSRSSTNQKTAPRFPCSLPDKKA